MTDPASVVRRFWDELWTGGRHDVVADVFHPDATENGDPVDIDGFAGAVAFWARTFPGFSATIEELIPIGDDRILTRVTYRGTQQGRWAGLPATGRSFTGLGIDIFRVQDGRIIELWHATDHLDMAMQLGGKLVLEDPVDAQA